MNRIADQQRACGLDRGKAHEDRRWPIDEHRLGILGALVSNWLLILVVRLVRLKT